VEGIQLQILVYKNCKLKFLRVWNMDRPRSHDINSLELFSSESGQVFGKLDPKNPMIILKNV
jgi:hypothetical protein